MKTSIAELDIDNRQYLPALGQIGPAPCQHWAGIGPAPSVVLAVSENIGPGLQVGASWRQDIRRDYLSPGIPFLLVTTHQ